MAGQAEDLTDEVMGIYHGLQEHDYKAVAENGFKLFMNLRKDFQ